MVVRTSCLVFKRWLQPDRRAAERLLSAKGLCTATSAFGWNADIRRKQSDRPLLGRYPTVRLRALPQRSRRFDQVTDVSVLFAAGLAWPFNGLDHRDRFEGYPG